MWHRGVMDHPQPAIHTCQYDANRWFAYTAALWQDGTRSIATGTGTTEDEAKLDAVAWAKRMALL